MTTIEKIIEINKVLKEVFNFVQNDKIIKPDFEEYIKTVGAYNITSTQMEKLFIPYIFERYIGEPAKSIVELFNEKNKSAISKNLLNTQYTIFEIKRLLKNGFKLYNMTNEKEYEVISLVKMTNFRGIGIGDYIVARIFNIENEFYLIGIDNVLSSSQSEDANRYAVLRIAQAPWLVYQDNEEKEAEIKEIISKTYKKFVKLTGSDEIITLNKYADDIIGQLSDENIDKEFDIKDYIEPIENFKFFELKKSDNNYDNFLENSLGGFSNNNEEYDIGIITDKDFGIYAIPFYGTFCAIFENKNIENKKACIEYILNSDSVSDNIIRRIAKKYPSFMKVINQELNTDYTLESLIQKYKSDFLRRNIYSSTCVLSNSNVLSESLELINA